MKTKRKSIALLLALMMCLSLLSACGANNTPDTEEPPASGNTSTEQQSADEKEKQPSQELKQEESTQKEPEKINNAGTEFLALLQKEYENGFVEGEGPVRTYYCYNPLSDGIKPFIHNGVVYRVEGNNKTGYDIVGYDITTKEVIGAVPISNFFIEGGNYNSLYFIDGNFYFVYRVGSATTRIYDCNGELLNEQSDIVIHTPFDMGFLCYVMGRNGLEYYLLWSYNLEKIAEIPVPQHEIEHGLKEDVELNLNSMFAADGTIYVPAKGNDGHLYRLNTDTYEWEDTGDAPASIKGHSFLGKYISCNDGIYDRVTGEQVFEYGELYHAACDSYDSLCYFGGDKYLGKNGSEYRWVNLTDLSMSEPLTFPEVKDVTILNDTYCIYQDKYGLFLWNYNDGTEETIMMFDN